MPDNAMEALVREWNATTDSLKFSVRTLSPKLYKILEGISAQLADPSGSMRAPATVHVLPPPRPFRPGAGSRSVSPGLGGHLGPPATRDTPRPVESRQESLLEECPACDSDDPKIRLEKDEGNSITLLECDDPWHN